MRNAAARVVLGIAAVVLAAGCSSTTGGSPAIDPGSGPSSWLPPATSAGQPVGELHHEWMQFDEDLGDAVPAYANQRPSPILIKDQSEYNAWHLTLPPELQPAVDDVTLDQKVAVVGYYFKCTEVSSIQNHGDGEIEFDVAVPPDKQGTLCEAAPINLELWIIDLDELDVDGPDDILLKG